MRSPFPRFRTAFVVGILSLACFVQAKETRETNKGKRMQSENSKSVTSKDGTKIIYDKVGEGPALILVGGALSARAGAGEFVKVLAPHFTVYSYDRRGRGESGDTKPYAIAREVEDLEALIGAAGGSAYVYGKSSGAALSLEAAAALGGKIQKLALYEAPYSDAEGAAKEWKTFRSRLNELLAAGKHDEAVSEFLEFVGAPKAAIAGMKLTPSWKGMVAMAPTLAYDNALLGDDRSVPVKTASRIKAPTLVMDGGDSQKAMPFMRPTADKIAQAIPKSERRTLEGQGHDVDPKALSAALVKFFSD
jgi:pimeloyl-ACP methyl ester carboxylesterase